MTSGEELSSLIKEIINKQDPSNDATLYIKVPITWCNPVKVIIKQDPSNDAILSQKVLSMMWQRW